MPRVPGLLAVRAPLVGSCGVGMDAITGVEVEVKVDVPKLTSVVSSVSETKAVLPTSAAGSVSFSLVVAGSEPMADGRADVIARGLPVLMVPEPEDHCTGDGIVFDTGVLGVVDDGPLVD